MVANPFILFPLNAFLIEWSELKHICAFIVRLDRLIFAWNTICWSRIYIIFSPDSNSSPTALCLFVCLYVTDFLSRDFFDLVLSLATWEVLPLEHIGRKGNYLGVMGILKTKVNLKCWTTFLKSRHFFRHTYLRVSPRTVPTSLVYAFVLTIVNTDFRYSFFGLLSLYAHCFSPTLEILRKLIFYGLHISA